MATACDWVPTLANLCQVDPPEYDLDGRDLKDVLASDEADSPHDSFFWQLGSQVAVREGSWKLYRRDGNSAWELYQVAEDLAEEKNLANVEPERVRELQQQYETWRASWEN